MGPEPGLGHQKPVQNGLGHFGLIELNTGLGRQDLENICVPVNKL